MTETGPPLPLLSRYAIMVDVGYIYASAGELLFSAASRREYRVDADKLIQALSRLAEDKVRGELLRVYWYDAARDRVPTIDQRVIAQMPSVKLRLGNLNARGQQKGVDAQIRADMEALARHRAITDAILVGGRRGHGARGRGRAGVWRPHPPVGRRAAVRHEPGRAARLGIRHRRRARALVRRALFHPAAGSARAGPRPQRRASRSGQSRAGRGRTHGAGRAVPGAGIRGPARVPADVQAPSGLRSCRGPGSAPTGNGSRKPASTSPRSGYSPAARTTSETCCPARSCRRSSTRSCSSTPRGTPACPCAPTRRPGSGCATPSGLECIASSGSESASRRAEFHAAVTP